MNKIDGLFFLRPWAIKEDVLGSMVGVVHRHLLGEKFDKEEILARIGSDQKKESPGYEVTNGVARIPVHGIISKRMNMVADISQRKGTAIEAIARDFQAALSDESVSKIILDIDSPGGTVDGVADLADLIFSSRGKKPILAFADGQMASAAYWIGSAADRVFATQSADVGSIGVYSVVRDFSTMEHNAGIKTTIIKAGRYKAAGHPSQRLSDDEQSVLQDEINAHYRLFVEAVRRNRSMSAKDVEKITDGRVWIGSQAFNLKLVDGIRSESYFPEAIGSVGSSSKNKAALSIEDKCRADWERNPKLHKEFRSLESYIGYQRGVATGRIKIYSRAR